MPRKFPALQDAWRQVGVYPATDDGEMTVRTILEMTTGAHTPHQEVLRISCFRRYCLWAGGSYRRASSLSHPQLYSSNFLCGAAEANTEGNQRAERQESHEADTQDEDAGVWMRVMGPKSKFHSQQRPEDPIPPLWS